MRKLHFCIYEHSTRTFNSTKSCSMRQHLGGINTNPKCWLMCSLLQMPSILCAVLLRRRGAWVSWTSLSLSGLFSPHMLFCLSTWVDSPYLHVTLPKLWNTDAFKQDRFWPYSTKGGNTSYNCFPQVTQFMVPTWSHQMNISILLF